MTFPEPMCLMDIIPIKSANDWGYVAYHRGIPLDEIDDPEARAGWLEAKDEHDYLMCVLKAQQAGANVSWDDVPF